MTLRGGFKAASPERESGERFPFSLLLADDAELGLDAEALPENWRVLQSGEAQRDTSRAVIRTWRHPDSADGSRAAEDSGRFLFVFLPFQQMRGPLHRAP